MLRALPHPQRECVVLRDAHTTEELTEYGLPPADKVIAHTNTYWGWHEGPGRTASVVEAAAVTFDRLDDAWPSCRRCKQIPRGP